MTKHSSSCIEKGKTMRSLARAMLNVGRRLYEFCNAKLAGDCGKDCRCGAG